MKNEINKNNNEIIGEELFSHLEEYKNNKNTFPTYVQLIIYSKSIEEKAIEEGIKIVKRHCSKTI